METRCKFTNPAASESYVTASRGNSWQLAGMMGPVRQQGFSFYRVPAVALGSRLLVALLALLISS